MIDLARDAMLSGPVDPGFKQAFQGIEDATYVSPLGEGDGLFCRANLMVMIPGLGEMKVPFSYSVTHQRIDKNHESYKSDPKNSIWVAIAG